MERPTLLGCAFVFDVLLSLGVFICGYDVDVAPEQCGFHALSLVLRSQGADVEYQSLRRLLPEASAPFSVADLEHAAKSQGFDTWCAKWQDPTCVRFDCPAVLHVRGRRTSREPDHFIACFGSVGDRVCVASFPRAPFLVTRDELAGIWEGVALYIDEGGSPTIATLRWQSYYHTAVRAVGSASAILIAALLGVFLLRKRLQPTSAEV